jgi:hypothetical protein
MSRYQFRYFFSPDCRVCLWSANAEANEKFNYPVDLNELGLPENILKKAIHIMAWYDTSIDWNYPPDPSPWSDEERCRFNASAQCLLVALREQLGPEFEIRDESRTLSA